MPKCNFVKINDLRKLVPKNKGKKLPGRGRILLV
jgi:hypothetical protein